jgi:hypothetical protein
VRPDEPRRKKQQKEEHELQERSRIIGMLADEVAVQRTSFAARSSSMNTRLSVLVAAASLATGMQVDMAVPHLPYVVGACLAASAAMAGVVALWPLGGGENGVQSLQNEVWNESTDRAAYLLMHRQLEVLKEDESRLSFRAWCARVGYALLAASIVAVAVQVAVPG